MTHYKQLPKSVVIKNSIEVQNYLKEHYNIVELWNKYQSPETHPYLVVAISNSNSGYIYYRQSFYTQDDYNRYLYNNDNVKEIVNPMSLYSYLDQCMLIKKLRY